MQLTQLSKQAGELLRKIGPGRRLEHIDSALTLRYSVGGGDGLVVHAHVLGQPLRLWLSHDQWCQWIKPVLEVPSWSATPPELLEVLANWTLASADSALAGSAVAWPTGSSIEATKIKKAPYWRLGIEHGDRHLDTWIIEAPVEWLASLADELEAMEDHPDIAPRTIPVALIAGWSSVDQKTLKHLLPGDGLFMQQAYQTANGELGLFMNQPLATLSVHNTPNYILKATMTDFDDWLEMPAAASDTSAYAELPVTVVVQVASIEVPLYQLANLQKGDLLEGPVHMQSSATLKVAGRTIGHGLLLEIDGRLAVRIDSLT